MKILLQVALVFGIYWVGQGIEAVLPFAFPASVISLLLLLVLLLAGIAALWNSLRLGFASRAALHIVLAVAVISATILSTTVWKQRGRATTLLIAATGAVLAVSRLAAMLAYLADLWSGSRSYADGGDWPIVWESAGNWLQSDLPYYLFYLVLIVGGLLLARRLKKRGEA